MTTAQCDAAKAFIQSNATAVSRNVTQDIFFPRLDYQLNGNNHLSASFNWQNYKQPNGYTTSNTNNNSSPSTNGRADFHERFFVANWESVVSSRSANTVRFQWSRDLETTGANAPGPNVTMSGLFAYGMPNALPRGAFPDEHRWQFADIFSTVRGKHSFKFGADVNLIHEQLSNLFQGGGIYSYQAFTGQKQTGTYGAFYNWVQDIYGVNGGRHYFSFTQVNDPITHVGADDFWNDNIAGFAEDAWKIRPDLTVTLGIRYDVQQVPQPPKPYTTSFNGAPSPLGNFYTSKINNNYKMVQPRIGFVWSPHNGTVFRGGYGMFYGLTSGSTLYCTRVRERCLPAAVQHQCLVYREQQSHFRFRRQPHLCCRSSSQHRASFHASGAAAGCAVCRGDCAVRPELRSGVRFHSRSVGRTPILQILILTRLTWPSSSSFPAISAFPSLT